MRLLKPSWISHEGHSIFSLDIHPDGSRLATGGQGDDCGRVVIWNMSPVLHEEDEKDENVPKMLCQMDNHLACVNCVRWSNNGRYLASAGDDKVIMIWQTGRYAGGSSIFGGSAGKVNVEQWRCVSTLRGHSGDILDLAWSPQDIWIASCSVDNSVIVWNAVKMPEITSVLKGHTGLVKGVAWDPVGKYLASQSDDKSLRVWRTSDWHMEINITEPFLECGGTTHVLRLCWSPDGQYLVSAHAMNNSGPTAQIIDRDGWRIEKDFVGHRKAVTCVRFNPNILSKLGKMPGKVHHYCCCAIGSRDRTLSVWLTALKRPLVVIHDLFTNSILDISWNCLGDQLMACSGDGSVALLSFSKEEIGQSLTEEEKNAFYQKIYGKSLSIGNHLSSANTIIENPEILRLKKSGEEDQQIQQQQQQQENDKVTTPIKGPVNCQIETRTPDGRRRITPMFIAAAPDLGDAPQPFNSRSQPTFSSSTERQSKILIEKRDEHGNSMLSNGSCTSMDVVLAPSTLEPVSTSTTPVVSGLAVISSSNAVVSTVVSSAMTTANNNNNNLDKRKTTYPDASGSLDRNKELYKGSKSIEAQRKELISKLTKRSGPSRSAIMEKLVHQHVPEEKEVVVALSSPAVTYAGQDLHLPSLRPEKNPNFQMTVGKGESALQLQLENDMFAAATARIHRVKCTKYNKQSWEALLPSRGCALAASRHLVCIVCEDKSLSVFSLTGRRLFPAIVLTSQASRLVCNGFYVMAITSRGFVTVWDAKTPAVIVKNESLMPIMSGDLGDLAISGTLLTDKGCPVVTLSTGKSFSFSVDMGCWMLIHDADDVVQQCSDHHACLPSSSEFKGNNLPLMTVQSQFKRMTQQTLRLFRSNPPLQQAGTLCHIDNQMSSALALQSAKEFKFWLLTLVRYLVQEGLEVRLREVCDFLLCSPSKSKLKADVESKDVYILGMHKNDLLAEVLPVVGSKLQLQRLYTEYHEQLELACI